MKSKMQKSMELEAENSSKIEKSLSKTFKLKETRQMAGRYNTNSELQ